MRAAAPFVDPARRAGRIALSHARTNVVPHPPCLRLPALVSRPPSDLSRFYAPLYTAWARRAHTYTSLSLPAHVFLSRPSSLVSLGPPIRLTLRLVAPSASVPSPPPSPLLSSPSASSPSPPRWARGARPPAVASFSRSVHTVKEGGGSYQVEEKNVYLKESAGRVVCGRDLLLGSKRSVHALGFVPGCLRKKAF